MSEFAMLEVDTIVTEEINPYSEKTNHIPLMGFDEEIQKCLVRTKKVFAVEQLQFLGIIVSYNCTNKMSPLELFDRMKKTFEERAQSTTQKQPFYHFGGNFWLGAFIEPILDAEFVHFGPILSPEPMTENEMASLRIYDPRKKDYSFDIDSPDKIRIRNVGELFIICSLDG